MVLEKLVNRFEAKAVVTQTLGPLEGIGPLGNPTGAFSSSIDVAANTFTKILSNIIGVMTVIAIIWFVFTFFTGAIAWLGSGGDKTKLQNSQKQITTGIIGLIIVISAIFLIELIGTLVGVPDILNISDFILKLAP